jgi:hypothetical protein
VRAALARAGLAANANLIRPSPPFKRGVWLRVPWDALQHTKRNTGQA